MLVITSSLAKNGLYYFENLLLQTEKSCEKYLIYGGQEFQTISNTTVLPWKKAGEIL